MTNGIDLEALSDEQLNGYIEAERSGNLEEYIKSLTSDNEDDKENNDGEEEQRETKEDKEVEEENEKEENEENELFKIEVNGKEIELTKEELLELAKDSAQKQLKKQDKPDFKKTLETNNLKEEELALLAEAKKGNIKALAKLVKELGGNEDLMELLEEEDLDVEAELKVEKETELDEIYNKIESDKKIEENFNELTNVLPEEVIESIGTNVNAMKVLLQVAERGAMDEVVKEATIRKLKGDDWEEALFKGVENFAKRQAEKKEKEKKKKEQIKKQLKEDGRSEKEEKTIDDLWDIPLDKLNSMTQEELASFGQ